MNDINARNIVVIVAAVIIGLVVLGFIGMILSNIVPLAIVALIAFILGRTSHRVNYLQLGRNAVNRAREAAETSVEKAAARAETRKEAAGYGEAAQDANQRLAQEARTAAEAAAARAEQRAAEAPARLVESETPAEDLTAKPDFVVKTAEQIQAESRLIEEEAAKKAQAMDVQSALEERRRRLLGEKGDQE
ncbi:MAG: hypothetical protein DWB42_12990 [Chloroflexi bacterium]|nr:hypothetical protein [Chloroflexota bacterium]MDL1884206.1 hypothetical protein [Anaerolineae bacterium CFX8]